MLTVRLLIKNFLFGPLCLVHLVLPTSWVFIDAKHSKPFS